MYSALFLLVIFYNWIEYSVPMANYWDEMSTIIVLGWGALSVLRNPKMSLEEFVNWLLLLALVVIGALGNVVHPGLQTEFSVLIRDVMALIKFPVIFFMFERRKISGEKQRKILRDCAAMSRGIVAVTAVAAVIGYFVDLGFYDEEVRILRGFQFGFSHPTFFVSAYVMIAAVLMAESMQKNRAYILLDCVLLFLAQRTKGYVFILAVVMFVLLGEKRITGILKLFFGTAKEKVKITRVVLLAAALGAVFVLVGWNKLQDYISWGMTAARSALHIVGVRIMLDYFPLGSGFGTFASHLSGRHYSNIYDLYGVSHVDGMSRTRYNYISDVFWPYIYGQFGVFGLLIYIKLIFSAFIRQYRSNITDGCRLAVVAVWIYALIASTSEAYFTNGTGVQMALLLTVIIGYSGEGAKRPGETEPQMEQKRMRRRIRIHV